MRSLLMKYIVLASTYILNIFLLLFSVTKEKNRSFTTPIGNFAGKST